MSHLPFPARGAVAQSSIIEAYEALLLFSSKMRDCAVAADWDSLFDHKASYLAQVERIKQLEEDGPLHLDVDHQQSKTALVERILDQDEQIRQRLIARRDELGRLIGDSRWRASVARSYESHKGELQNGESLKGAAVTDLSYHFTQKPS